MGQSTGVVYRGQSHRVVYMGQYLGFVYLGAMFSANSKEKRSLLLELESQLYISFSVAECLFLILYKTFYIVYDFRFSI